jgi:hypothetical protein
LPARANQILEYNDYFLPWHEPLTCLTISKQCYFTNKCKPNSLPYQNRLEEYSRSCDLITWRKYGCAHVNKTKSGWILLWKIPNRHVKWR